MIQGPITSPYGTHHPQAVVPFSVASWDGAAGIWTVRALIYADVAAVVAGAWSIQQIDYLGQIGDTDYLAHFAPPALLAAGGDIARATELFLLSRPAFAGWSLVEEPPA